MQNKYYLCSIYLIFECCLQIVYNIYLFNFKVIEAEPTHDSPVNKGRLVSYMHIKQKFQ